VGCESLSTFGISSRTGSVAASQRRSAKLLGPTYSLGSFLRLYPGIRQRGSFSGNRSLASVSGLCLTISLAGLMIVSP
jgi:hypothetical protein